jgi:hypothetical protein
MKLGIFECCAKVTAAEICLLIKNLCKLFRIYVLVGPVGFELLKRAIASFFWLSAVRLSLAGVSVTF